MPSDTQTYTVGPKPNTVRAADGTILEVPGDWALLPPGDPGLTRRVKSAGPSWVVQERRGRKVFSRGVWAPAATIERIKVELEAERSTDQYARKQEVAADQRNRKQSEYVTEFRQTVIDFLAFAPRYAEIADQLATLVADHATPVGSGTVARTTRIPVEQRAEAAVIAWLRHQTTTYDSMKIARIRGKRREVRRALAAQSKELLMHYRRGDDLGLNCPLQRAILQAVKAEHTKTI